MQALLETIPEAHRGTWHVVEGQPAHSVVELAGEGYDALLVSTHGRSGLAHFWLGSVAERIVRSAPCAVVVMRVGQQAG